MAMVRLCAAQSLPPPEDAARMLREGALASPVHGGSVASTPREGGGARPLSQASTDRASQSRNANPGEAQAGQESRFQTFEDVIARVAEERDIELELALERMRVTSFSPAGEIEYIPAPDQPRDLVRRLKAFLEEHTPHDWRIASAEERSAPVESLAERRRREEARALEELKRQPFVAEALKHFPGAEIAAVRHPVEEGSGGGDVVAMPAPQNTPNAARKKEADR
jgi:DNA polymerase-3 subunit gamma/tau